MMEPVSEEIPMEELTITQILQHHNLAVYEMFTIPDIHKRLKSNIKEFSEYLKLNDHFMFEMINLGIKIPIHESQD